MQQSDEPDEWNRPPNLWEPMDAERDFGAFGRFDAQANPDSPQFFGTMHRRALWARATEYSVS